MGLLKIDNPNQNLYLHYVTSEKEVTLHLLDLNKIYLYSKVS